MSVEVPYFLYLVIQCSLHFNGEGGGSGESLIVEQAMLGDWLGAGSTEGSRCLEFDLGISMGLSIFRILEVLFGALDVGGRYIALGEGDPLIR